MKKLAFLIIFSFLSAVYVRPGFAHCEIPCGIYDDELRISIIEEHIATIEKSMNEIKELSKEGDKNYNQIVRWVGNKEKHAIELMHVVTQYFMTQRIKPADSKDNKAHMEYENKLVILHQMLIYAMKCKQTIDLDNVGKLRSLVAKFKDIYFKKE